MITRTRNPLFLLLLLCFTLFSSKCKEENNEPCGKQGTMTDLFGQDGCFMMIEDDITGDRVSPSNLADWATLWLTGDKVNYSYNTDPNIGDCQLGVSVSLTCLEKR